MREPARSLGLALVLVLASASLGPATAQAQDAPPAELGDRLEAVLDGAAPTPAERVAGDELRVLVQGPPPSVEAPADDRGAAVAALDAAHAGFRDAVRAAAADAGLAVNGTVAAANAAFLEGDAEALREGFPEVRAEAADRGVPVHRAGLDRAGAVDRQATATGEQVDAVNATGAGAFHDLGFRGENVTLAVVDSGIAPEHPCFRTPEDASRVVAWKDLVNGREDPYDDYGHGTHVAGIAAGSPPEADCEEPGVAPRADLMGVKMLNENGSGTWKDAQEALEWAFENGADVATNSWGGPCSAGGNATRDLVNELAEAGLEQAFSAGNEGPEPSTVTCPATARHAVTVGATDRDRDVLDFSSRGPCEDAAGERTCPDVAAIGESVRSAVPGGYSRVSGTSMAAPMAGGGAVLVEQAHRELLNRSTYAPGGDPDRAPTYSEAEHLFRDTADPLPDADLAPNNDTGWGFLALDATLDEIRRHVGPRVRASGTASPDPVTRCEAATVAVELSNDSAVAIGEGTYRLVHRAPDGTSAREGSLALDADEVVVLEQPIDGTDAPGVHTVSLRYNYTWFDEDDNRTREGTASAAASVAVEVPRLAASGSLPATALAGVPFETGVAAHNTGTSPVASLAVETRVPASHRVLPDPLAGTTVASWFSTPPPDEVALGFDGATFLRYDVGDLAPGEAWTLSYEAAGHTPGVRAFETTLTYDAGCEQVETTLVEEQLVRPAPDAAPP